MAVKKIKDSSGAEHVIDATLWNSYESPEAMGLLSGVKNITYSDLVTLRNNSNLAPGQQYRITDYVTTTVQDNTQSAGHLFDIIVTALSNNTLDEEAYAMCSERDTDNYFGTSELNAWKLWYCLDNDRERFGWADTTNGKGVIYRMIDEFNNDCSYDFKNIKYYHNGMGTYVYTFTWIDENYNVMDSSVFGNNGTLTFNGKIYGVSNNVIKPYYTISDTPDEHTGDYVRQQCLNNIVFISDYSYQGKGNDGFCGCNNNSFGNECYKNSFGNYCYANSFGNYCYNNSFGNYCCSNSFRNECYANTFGSNCDYNSFGNDCNYNSFGNECQYNTFGNNCDYNSFGNKCYKNSFVNNCNNNSFGNNCCYNTFGNNCYKNSFVDECYSNSFGNECYSNSFGNDCRYNSFGNDCRYNSFGNSCRNNLFGNYCYANSFVNECCSNSFGNYCYANFFGNYCCSNSFGNECYRIYFGQTASKLKSNYRNIIIDNGNCNIFLNCTSTTSSSKYYQNVRIGLGVNNTTTYKTISDSNVNQTYETLYLPKNSQTITI